MSEAQTSKLRYHGALRICDVGQAGRQTGSKLSYIHVDSNLNRHAHINEILENSYKNSYSQEN